MKKVFKIFALLMVFSMVLTACSNTNTSSNTQNTQNQPQQEAKKEDENKIKVLTTIYPVYDFAKKIAGDKADVENLIPTDSQSHGWEPSANDIAKLEKADVFVYSGAGMEMWVDDVLKSVTNKDLVTVEASQGVTLLENHEHEDEHDHDGAQDHEHEHEGAEEGHDHEDEHGHHHGKYDPHVWMSIKNAKKQMENIKNALVSADEKNKDYYEENYEKYAQEFDALDAKYAETLKNYNGKSIVVAHEAFAYLVSDYGIKQLGIEGVYEDSEPDPAKMKEIIDFVKANDVKVIFFETLSSNKASETIAKETGIKTDVLNPIEGLTEQEEKSGKEYLSLMQDNLTALENSFK